jgi:hypothetical protein
VLPPGREVEPAEGRAVHHLEDGRVLVWEPETPCGAIACHAERLDSAPHRKLAAVCVSSRAQVVARLADVPVGARLRTETLVRPDLGLVVSLAAML